MSDKFSELLPPLSSEEFSALKADIGANGILHPVFVDEDGNILDGRHRLKIAPNAPRKIISGLSESEKEAFVFRCNFVRRNLSPDQKREARRKMKATAERLRGENPKKWTQERIAKTLGVSQSTVAGWLTTNIGSDNGCGKTADARVKIPSERKAEIAERIDAGESQSQVAADFGVSHQAISKIVNKVKKQSDHVAARARSISQTGLDPGIRHGDFRKILADIPDNSVDLIFTDPPYDRKSLPLFKELGTFAARVLCKHGSLVTFYGQSLLPEVLPLLMESGLKYRWIICVSHEASRHNIQMPKVYCNQKPMLWLSKSTPFQNDFVADLIKSTRPKKKDHPWEQSVVEAEYMIKSLTPKNGLVVDPFAGSGTTLVAAKTLGRSYIGAEIKKEHCITASARLKAFE